MRTDLRHALRSLLNDRGMATIAVVSLALALALNTTVMAVMDAYLFKSLPYPEADRLYSIRYEAPNRRPPAGMEALDWASLDAVIEHPIAWDLDMFYLVGGDHPEQAPGAWVTPGFMEGLGIRAAMGRAFTPADYHPGSPQVALVSYALWRTRFGGDAAIVGRQFRAYVSDRPEEAETFTIVGVLPDQFWHVNPYTEILVPLRAATYPYMARLREGVTAADAERRVTELVRAGAENVAPDWRARVVSVHTEYVARVRPMLVGVAWAAGLVLLIACANVTFLLLIRAARRDKEVALRLALGAGRWQLARLLLAEGLVLAGAATVAGLMASGLALAWLAPLVQRQLGRPAPGGASAIVIDAPVVGVVLATGAITTIVFGLAPLMFSWRANLSRAMQAGTRAGTDTTARRRARGALVALEVAVSLALVAGCGLMVRSVVRLLGVDVGYRTEQVLVGTLTLRERSYPDPGARLLFYDRLLSALGSDRGPVALASVPIVATPTRRAIEADTPGGGVTVETGSIAVGPAYFAALGVPRLDGREFTIADHAGSGLVAIVSETLARRLWPNNRAVGQRLRIAARDGDPRSPAWRTIVGVVRDVRQTSIDDDPGDLYLPFLEAPGRFASVHVLASAPPAASVASIRRALRAIDPEIAFQQMGMLDDLIARELARPRFLAGLLAAFAGCAVLLALIGVYGVIAYAVRQRVHEIAVRVAMGAGRADVIRLFVRQGAPIIVFGVASGLYGATLVGRLFESQLAGLPPRDPVTLLAAALGLAAAAFVAVWWPARRASRADPLTALRE